MIDEQTLRNMEGLAPTRPTRPAEEIISRGRRRQRRRQARRGGAGMVAVLAAVGGVTQLIDRERPLIAASQPGPVTQPESCGGYTDKIDPERVGPIRMLPSWLPAGVEIDKAFARADLTEKETCPPVPTALVAAEFAEDDRARVERSAVLAGPYPMGLNVDIYGGPAATEFDHAVVEEVELGAQPATSSVSPAGTGSGSCGPKATACPGSWPRTASDKPSS